MTTNERLLAIANEKLDRDTPLTDEDLPKKLKDVGIDSLDFMLVLVAVQEEFSISIPDEKVPEMESLAEVAALLGEVKN